ncbi:hypothetical protein [Catellatospora tritici]|uniref:hypothetical protein n=1 Tax=Catellatospora tritici TaxID=2851566 RepID=UPI001C2CF6A8|nr:hypothetical protein [Catellatospora tritici]MBV1856369.1 hypothetical protein [Catellatospora tritici]
MRRFKPFIAASCVVLAVASGCTSSTAKGDASAPKEFTSATIDSFVADLAEAGVAVYPTGSTTPVVKVDSPGPLALSQEQAGSAALGAWAHAGLSGSDVDKLAAMPPLALGAQPIPAALLIAGWSQVAPSPAAKMAKKILGEQDWSHYQQAVFPAAVLALFAADVAAMGRSAGTGGAGGGAAAADSVCEQFKGFISSTIEKVFAAIGRFEVKGFTGDVLKDIFIFIRDTGAVLGNLALDTVKFLVVNGVEVALGPVLNGIAAVAGIAAVVSSIVLILQPWTADVRPDPLISRRDESAHAGTVTLTMRGITGNTDWPAELTGCAGAAGVTLPSLRPKDANLSWTITNQHPAPMIVEKSDTAVLKDDGTATMRFETLPETPDVAKGEEQIDGVALLDIVVHRKDLDQVHKLITGEIFKFLPALVDKTFGGTIRDIVDPQIQKLLQPLTTLRDMTVKTVIPVNYHTKEDDKTAKPGGPSASPIGKLTVPDGCPTTAVSGFGFQSIGSQVVDGVLTCFYSRGRAQLGVGITHQKASAPPCPGESIDVPGADAACFDNGAFGDPGVRVFVSDGGLLVAGGGAGRDELIAIAEQILVS